MRPVMHRLSKATHPHEVTKWNTTLILPWYNGQTYTFSYFNYAKISPRCRISRYFCSGVPLRRILTSCSFLVCIPRWIDSFIFTICIGDEFKITPTLNDLSQTMTDKGKTENSAKKQRACDWLILQPDDLTSVMGRPLKGQWTANGDSLMGQ